MKIRRTNPDSRFYNLHTHSRYSAEDALPTVEEIVEQARLMGQDAVGLSDHGNMAGAVELYQQCRKKGLQPIPGSEFYLVPDIDQHKIDRKTKDGTKASRYHVCIYAYNTIGYENLVRLSTISHQQHFYKPLIDFRTLGQLSDDDRLQGLAVTSGCFFGYAVQQLLEHGEEATKDYLRLLQSWFGETTYVELQNHNIIEEGRPTDDEIADQMLAIADSLSLPCVITQDSHYLKADDRELHDTLKRLVAFGADPDEAVFPGDGFHLADYGWIAQHHSGDRLERGLQGLADLKGRSDLHIGVLDSYAYNVPRVVAEPQQVMEKTCWKNLADKGLDQPRYVAQLKEEFDVIAHSGMAGYMVLVAEVCEWMREHEVVFQTRGSAAGSLVCYLLGITNVDPLKWDLRFNRFLSKDRTKPPDVDLDISHDRRDELIEWLDSRFTAHQIGTWMRYSLTKDDDDETQGGSLLVKYYSQYNKVHPDKDEQIHSWDEIPKEDQNNLKRLSEMSVYKGMGVNAAGVVLTSTPQEFNRLVPLAYRSRGGFVSQYHLKAIEDLGLVKLDVLGSKTLSVLKQCMDNLGEKVSFLDEVPTNDPKVYKIIKSGNTAGIFQLEGKSSMWGSKSLKPDRIADVIAAMALFRPGVQGVKGDKRYIARKHGKEPVPQRHELIQKVVGPTYGILLYQEQVIDILREMGMEADDLTAFLKAVKASNSNVAAAAKVIASYRPWIEQRSRELGMTDEDLAYLDSSFEAYSNYSFNRSHATVYGLTAYKCAWLATHCPVEFHAALLSVAGGTPKENHYIAATRSRGIRILPPSLNVSGYSYTVDKKRGAIRKGLLSVKGVGGKAAQILAERAPYTDIDDLLERTPARPVSGKKDYDGDLKSLNGVLGALRDAGVLDELTR